MPPPLPTASILDTARTVRDVLLPLVAQGPILRRPRLLGLTDQLETGDRALRRVRQLRRRYGDGPLLLRLPGRSLALVLEPDHVWRLLDETPEPFSAATTDKVGALRHFQPHGVLVSDPPLRAARRSLNEQALDTTRPVHRHGQAMADTIAAELDTLHATLGWTDFREIWSRAVRRIVLGESARDDTELTALLDGLRADANWAAFRPRRKAARERFQGRVTQYVEKAEPGSLVAALPHGPSSGVDPAGQVPHWLFAFDAAGIALWRTFAVLATRPELTEPIVAEARQPGESRLLTQAGAAVQESLRLWPTTLLILREGQDETTWPDGTAPAGTQFAIVSSVFHRDDEALDFADRFEPAVWLDGRAAGGWPVIPFSAGPAVCPGQNVVLLTTSAAVSHVASRYELDVDPATRDKLAGAMPAEFDPTAVRIGFWKR